MLIRYCQNRDVYDINDVNLKSNDLVCDLKIILTGCCQYRDVYEIIDVNKKVKTRCAILT